MAKPSINIQDGFLFQILKGGLPIEVQLVTGGSVRGILKRFDRFALVLESDGQEILVYKHGIVSVQKAQASD